MLKFAANLSLLFTELELKDRFHAARQHGFSAVEIQFPYSLPPETIQTILQETGLKLVQFNMPADDLMQGGEGLTCVPHKIELFNHALAEVIEYAQILQPEVINILPGRCFDNDHLADYIKTLKHNLQFAADTFSLFNIKTVFEAINNLDMPGFIINSGAQMLEILDELKHPNLFMQYDVYHASKMGDDAAQFISLHADKIGHIQIADYPDRGQPNTGQLDFPHLFDVIKQSGYAGWIGAEYKPIGTTANSLYWFRKLNS